MLNVVVLAHLARALMLPHVAGHRCCYPHASCRALVSLCLLPRCCGAGALARMHSTRGHLLRARRCLCCYYCRITLLRAALHHTTCFRTLRCCGPIAVPRARSALRFSLAWAPHACSRATIASPLIALRRAGRTGRGCVPVGLCLATGCSHHANSVTPSHVESRSRPHYRPFPLYPHPCPCHRCAVPVRLGRDVASRHSLRHYFATTPLFGRPIRFDCGSVKPQFGAAPATALLIPIPPCYGQPPH